MDRAVTLSRRLAVLAFVALLALAGLPGGASALGGAEQATLRSAVVHQVVSVRTVQLTERGISHVAAWPMHDAQRTDVLVAQHPRPHFRPAVLPLQSLLSVYRI